MSAADPFHHGGSASSTARPPLHPKPNSHHTRAASGGGAHAATPSANAGAVLNEDRLSNHRRMHSRPNPNSNNSNSAAAAVSAETLAARRAENDDPMSVNSQSTNASFPTKGGANGAAGDPLADAADQEHVTKIAHMFKFVFALMCLINVDAGALPATLPAIDHELHLSFTQLGALGGLAYLGLFLASLFGGQWLQRYDQKRILGFSMIGNGICVFLFGIAPWPSVLLIVRTMIGFTQAFFVIYAPVWVDEFAPSSRQTVWMSMLQVSTPLGVMLGYGFGIASNWAHGDIIAGWGSWRAVFILQGVVIVPTSACLFLIPDRYLKTADQLARSGEKPVHGRNAVTTSMGLLDENNQTQAAAMGGSGAEDVAHHRFEDEPSQNGAGAGPRRDSTIAINPSLADGTPGADISTTAAVEDLAKNGLVDTELVAMVAAGGGGGGAAGVGASPVVPAQVPDANAAAPDSATSGGGGEEKQPASTRLSPPKVLTASTGNASNPFGGTLRAAPTTPPLTNPVTGGTPATAPAVGSTPTFGPAGSTMTPPLGTVRASPRPSPRPSPRASPRSAAGKPGSAGANPPSFYMTPSARISKAFSYRIGPKASDISAITAVPITTTAAVVAAAGLEPEHELVAVVPPPLTISVAPLTPIATTTAGGMSTVGTPIGGPPSLTRRETGRMETRTLGVRQLLRLLWSKKVYVWTVFTLSTLYFCVTGIQYWITQYCVDYLGTSIGTVGLAFILVSATAPVLGVLFGGWYIDRLGGYSGKKQSIVAVRMDVLAIGISFVCAIIVSVSPSFAVLMLFTWFQLFFGGAVVPSLVGMQMAAVPQDMREFASALSQLVVNIFGYFLAPVLSGAVMQWSGGIEWGFRLCLWWGAVGMFGSLMLLAAARARALNSQLRRDMAKMKSLMQAVPEDGKLPPAPAMPQPTREEEDSASYGGRSIILKPSTVRAGGAPTLLSQLETNRLASTEPPVSVTVVASAGNSDGLEIR